LIMSGLVFAAILFGTAADPPRTQTVILTEEIRQAFDPVGDCEGNGRSFDLHRMMILEDRPVDIDSPDGPLRVSVHGEDLFFDAVGPTSPDRRYYTNVDSEIDPRDDLDIELKLAYFEGRLVLYWKETFQNRIYRQGLFSIAGHAVVPLCTGHGGRHVER